MHRFRRRSRRAFTCVLAGLLGTARLPFAATSSGAQSSQAAGSGLDKHDRALLAEAEANGDGTVTVLITSRPDANRDVVRGVQALGGRVDYRDDALGYLRVEIATDRAEQVSRLAGVQTADLDEVIPLDDPRPDGQTVPTPFPAPDATTPRDNPYMPIGETGADAFTDANPMWDGRGVTVGVLDTGITLDHPALQTTTTGAPKIVDLDGVAAGCRRRFAARQRGEPGGRAAPARSGPPGPELDGPLLHRLRCLRAGQRPHPGPRRVGAARHERHQDRRHHLVGSGRHGT